MDEAHRIPEGSVLKVVIATRMPLLTEQKALFVEGIRWAAQRVFPEPDAKADVQFLIQMEVAG